MLVGDRKWAPPLFQNSNHGNTTSSGINSCGDQSCFSCVVGDCHCCCVLPSRGYSQCNCKETAPSLNLKAASFYDAVDSITDLQCGMTNETEYVVFEHLANRGEFPCRQTVAAIRTQTDSETN